ncbi:MAG: aminotransferase class III-fold pyridoxal phosphate-dependent enzyme [Spirochaeta sp.]|jgi:glutamate-1-semialdehyde 2,1-aminomutase|nr:aminotransferase class III-fold pyridoxal phosphate-dependent enzyme [Spirochaeta sp.]
MNDEKRTGQELYNRAKELIPGGTQLLSKRPEMFLPDRWPSYYTRANGCEVTDLDGNTYKDFSIMGVGACILGYADPDVTEAVVRVVQDGNMSTLNAPEEVELAELLLELHPWAEKVRYARSGGEAMAIAVRLARAASGKDLVLFSGYHGWSDWYLAANISDDAALDGHLLSGLEPAGVPRALKETAIPFPFNDDEAFRALMDRYGDRVGAVVLEPIRNDPPKDSFRALIHETVRRRGIPLVVDEITAGFRLNVGGAHLVVGWQPDIAVFAKGMSNGHPMAAVIGTSATMDLAQSSFISSTYWTDRTGPTAALTTIRKMREIDAPHHLEQIGRMVQEGWVAAGAEHGLSVHAGGMYPLSHFDVDGESPLAIRTAFTQAMLDRGYLANRSLYVSLAHTEELVREYLGACDAVFAELAPYINEGRIGAYLKGKPIHSGFQRLN